MGALVSVFQRLALVSSLAFVFSASVVHAQVKQVKWDEILLLAKGKGLKGPWEQNDSRYDYVDDPSVALDPQGAIFTVWVDQGKKDVFFQKISAENRKTGPVLNISRSPSTFSWIPKVYSDPQNPRKIFVIWQEIIFSGGSHGGDIVFSRSTDGGKTFSPPVNISRSKSGDGKGRINEKVWHNGSYDLALSAQGMLHAVWTDYEGALWVSRSEDGGESFSKPRNVLAQSENPGPARAPTLAVNSKGHVFLAWTSGEDESADIRFAKSLDEGRSFGAASVVSPSLNYSDSPRLYVDTENVIHLVHAESRGGPFDFFQIHYSRSKNAGESFEKPRRISSLSESARYPVIQGFQSGNLVVVWESFPDPDRDPWGLSYVISKDGGIGFSKPQIVPDSRDIKKGTNGSQQGYLTKKMDTNSRGEIAIANSSLKKNKGSRVWLMRGRLE